MNMTIIRFASLPGLTRQSSECFEKLDRCGTYWIAGSSPAMTVGRVGRSERTGYVS
ncbi:MAG TPA: hypothetical protein VMQ73_25580 [Methylomirabilota bacterium]|nr:hypothetical protein [Methylomirabilota bacterium]